MAFRYPLIVQHLIDQQVMASQGETAQFRIQFRLRQRDIDRPALVVKPREHDVCSPGLTCAGSRLVRCRLEAPAQWFYRMPGSPDDGLPGLSQGQDQGQQGQ